jgi:hypothetical protein
MGLLPLDGLIRRDLSLTAKSFTLILPATHGKLLACAVSLYNG